LEDFQAFFPRVGKIGLRGPGWRKRANMDKMISELHDQYKASVETFALAIQNCPDAFWERIFGDNSPFWKEAYHTVYYLRNLVCSPVEAPSRTPFGFEMDPRLITKAQGAISKDDMLSFVAQTRTHIDRMFSELTAHELSAADNYAPGRFRSVFHRLLYGLRHCQHHAGKLTGYLFCNGIDYDPWR
jgi:hypothetical protein